MFSTRFDVVAVVRSRIREGANQNIQTFVVRCLAQRPLGKLEISENFFAAIQTRPWRFDQDVGNAVEGPITLDDVRFIRRYLGKIVRQSCPDWQLHGEFTRCSSVAISSTRTPPSAGRSVAFSARHRRTNEYVSRRTRCSNSVQSQFRNATD